MLRGTTTMPLFDSFRRSPSDKDVISQRLNLAAAAQPASFSLSDTSGGGQLPHGAKMSLPSLTQLWPNETRLLMDTTKIFAAQQQSGASTHESQCSRLDERAARPFRMWSQLTPSDEPLLASVIDEAQLATPSPVPPADLMAGGRPSNIRR